MAAKNVGSSLGAKLGDKLKKGFAAHAEDETKVGGGGDLPDGIEDGVAQLVECKFDVYKTGKNKGEFFFFASGVVMDPKTFKKADGRVVKVEGRRTNIGPEPLCDTPDRTRKTVDEHIGWVMNHYRLLGIDTAKLYKDNPNADVGALMEMVAKQLKAQKPFFNFRTWKGEKATEGPYKDKEPRVQHDWGGVTEWTGPIAQDVDDGTNDPAIEGEGEAGTEAPANEPAGEVTTNDDTSEELDLHALATAADDNDDEEAKTKLTERATAAGVTEKQIEAVANWAEVVGLIEGLVGTTGGSESSPVDFDALGAAADDGDQAAADQLHEMATSNGLDPEDSTTYPSWAALAAALKTAGDGGADAPADFLPAPSEVHYYKPWKSGPGGKKTRAAKAVECEVLSVDADKRTVDLKNLDDGKTTYKAVPIDDLGAE